VIADPIVDEVTVSHNFVSMLTLWFRITDGRLHVTATVRSNDVLIGWPANLYQISLLLSLVAEKLGVRPGTATTVSLSAHYFSDDDRLVEKLIGSKS
jgi:thymidylate synthase